MQELNPPETMAARPLFEPLSFHVSCAAVLSGDSPGAVLVDDPARLSAGFVLSPEAAYLAGDAGNRSFCEDLKAHLADSDGLGLPLEHLVFVVSAPEWAQWLAGIAEPGSLRRFARRHYVCETGGDFEPLPPSEGAVPRRIDAAFLADADFAKPEHLCNWIRHNWGSEERFLTHGFGVVTTCGHEAVSWSLADCLVDGIGEIGIHTTAAWRRKGLGAFTASGAVQCAFSIGLRSVGWHCHEENVASWRTAEKVGFALERTYAEYTLGRIGNTTRG